jgi:hypothetical protein
MYTRFINFEEDLNAIFKEISISLSIFIDFHGNFISIYTEMQAKEYFVSDKILRL